MGMMFDEEFAELFLIDTSWVCGYEEKLVLGFCDDITDFLAVRVIVKDNYHFTFIIMYSN